MAVIKGEDEGWLVRYIDGGGVLEELVVIFD